MHKKMKSAIWLIPSNPPSDLVRLRDLISSELKGPVFQIHLTLFAFESRAKDVKFEDAIEKIFCGFTVYLDELMHCDLGRFYFEIKSNDLHKAHQQVAMNLGSQRAENFYPHISLNYRPSGEACDLELYLRQQPAPSFRLELDRVCLVDVEHDPQSWRALQCVQLRI
jgi:hypothetical protein